ncbi:PREDICTED: uncharacterized protein LOC108356236 [Rhagoletis zephyria]|uniref:uncharacterized protein LOC108356236 n=1 Tax=Rhagoletis zephyria TaxID=28612 RepID=UPI0008118956|nr:PREDICTED: uncharacterized protein LOC108356236 [Rhagoletis zephyria]
MIRFMCDECITYIQNVDLVLQVMQMSVKKNNSILNEYKSEFEETMKKSQNEIKSLLEAVETRYTQRVAMMEKSQKLFEKKIGEVNNLYEMVEEVKNKTETIGKDNEKMHSEIKKLNNNTNEIQMSYAETIKNNIKKKALPELKNDVAIIVKPKVKQAVEKTKIDLNSKVDPKNLNISKIVSKNNGVMVIHSQNNDEREKIKDAIEKNIGKEYEIKVPNSIRPSFLIAGMNFKYENSDLIESIKKQNNNLIQGSLKVLKQFERNRGNIKVYNAIIEIDKEDFTKILAAERINIGWDRCKVFDAINVLMCYKCKGFNHKSADCKNEEACHKCHGKHNDKTCEENPINKCLNCIKANTNLNLALDINHDTFDRHCQCYNNKLEIKKQKLGY